MDFSACANRNVNARFRRWLSSAGFGLSVAALLLASVSATALAADALAQEPFATAIADLKGRDFQKKASAIAALARLEDPRTASVLRALLSGRLYYRKGQGKEVVIAEPEDGKYLITDVLRGEDLGLVTKRKLKRISLNNALRRTLRVTLARIGLFHEDAPVRLAAAKELTASTSDETIILLRTAFEKEQDSEVRAAMRVALALADLSSSDAEIRIAAIGDLSGSLQPVVRNRLESLLAGNADGSSAENDTAVRLAAEEALQGIQFKVKVYRLAETVFFGISLGSVLLLAAIGLAITFGVMGVINMAHGELMMLGAYTTYVIQTLMPGHIDFSLLIAIPAAFLVAGAAGIAIERGVIRFLYGRPLETLLATFGISLILQQAVRTVFSPLNRAVSTPSWMSGSWEINSAFSLTYNRLAIVVFSLMVFAALVVTLRKTPLGLQVRAVSQNRSMAKALGVRTEWVDALTFGLGSGIAGIAGVALSQLTNVGPNLGQSYIVDSFMVVVFGGVGNLWGTLVGSMTLGVANKFLEPFAGAVLAKIVILVFIIVFIQKRPRGLFPQKGRAAES